MAIVKKYGKTQYRALFCALFLLFGAVKNFGICTPCTSSGIIVSRHENVIKGAVVEEITLHSQCSVNSQETIERDALMVRYENAVGTILMCHGFMCDKTDLGVFRSLFDEGRYNIMSFDFRAHGAKKSGQTCTFGRDEAFDVLAAAQFIKNDTELKNKPLFVYAFSMGAVAAIEAQSQDASLFQAMILDCPFESSQELVGRSLDTTLFSLMGHEFKLPGRSLLKEYAFHPYIQKLVQGTLKAVAGMNPRDIKVNLCSICPTESVQKISVPSFFILCKNDEKVPVDAIKDLYQKSGSSYKTLWLTNGRGHFDSFFHSPERYKEKVRIFLDKVVTGKGNIVQINKQEIIEDIPDMVV